MNLLSNVMMDYAKPKSKIAMMLLDALHIVLIDAVMENVEIKLKNVLL